MPDQCRRPEGKDERFHRTLKFEVLRHFNFTTLAHCQREFEHFRERYNLVRPHDALGLATPAEAVIALSAAITVSFRDCWPLGVDVVRPASRCSKDFNENG